ncbi:MAG: MXAN_5187 C-terminal domain-containing protein [Vicinamibacterales bacterium]
MPPPRSPFERDMQMLEAELKRLEGEYNQFFAGRLPRLPWDSRTRVEALVRRHDRFPMQNTAERFRFQSLQARFSSFCELWDRTLKAREEGRASGVRRRRRDALLPAIASPVADGPPPSALEAPEDPRPRAEVLGEGLVAEASVRDAVVDAARIKDLYQRLSDAKRDAGEPPVSFSRFEKLVTSQVAKLGADGDAVAFRVTMKEGKVNLTARAIKE